MLKAICTCFYKAIVQRMFKHIAPEKWSINLNTAKLFSDFHWIKAH